MILSKKTAWLLHNLTSTQINQDASSTHLQSCCVYIQDVIDLQARRFFVTDGQHFISCELGEGAFLNCMGRYDLASMELRGMLVQVTEYRFIARRGVELVVEACSCIGEGSLFGETTDINEHAFLRSEPGLTIPYQIDFRSVATTLDCPLFCYVRDKLEEECDLNAKMSCIAGQEESADEDEPFILFNGKIQNKLSHLVPLSADKRLSEKNALREQDLNTSQSSSKFNSTSAGTETVKSSFEDIERQISFDDESRSSVIFNVDENGLQRCQSDLAEMKTNVIAEQNCREDPKISFFVPEDSFYSLGAATLEAISPNNVEPSLDKIFSDSFVALSDSPLVNYKQDSQPDNDPPCMPSSTEASFCPTEEDNSVIDEDSFISNAATVAPQENNFDFWFRRKKRMVEIRLPKRHKTMTKMPIGINPRNFKQKSEIIENRFFIMDDFFIDIPKIDECANSSYSSTETIHENNSNSNSSILNSIFEEQVYSCKRKPMVIKVCKGPYEPVREVNSSKNKSWLSIQPNPAISYYAAGILAKIYFTRDRSSTLLFQPSSRRLEAAKSLRLLSSKYIQPNRRGVRYVKPESKDKVPVPYSVPHIRFIRRYGYNCTEYHNTMEVTQLNFLVGTIRYALKRSSGQAGPYLLL